MKWVKEFSAFNLEGQIRGKQKNQGEKLMCKGPLVQEASDSGRLEAGVLVQA